MERAGEVRLTRTIQEDLLRRPIPFARLGFSRSASSTDCEYDSLGLTCEELRVLRCRTPRDGTHD